MENLPRITTPKVHEQVEKLLPSRQNKTLLDLGAGSGAFAQRAKTLGFHVTAVDISSLQFKAKVQFKSADLNKRLPFRAQSFDVITAIELIEHLENPHSLFREVNRVLKPGGTFILTTPNLTHYWSKLHFLFLNQFYQFDWANPKEIIRSFAHINPITLKELIFLANTNEMKIEKITYNRGTLALPYIKIPLMPKINIFGETLIIKLIGKI